MCPRPTLYKVLGLVWRVSITWGSVREAAGDPWHEVSEVREVREGIWTMICHSMLQHLTQTSSVVIIETMSSKLPPDSFLILRLVSSSCLLLLRSPACLLTTWTTWAPPPTAPVLGLMSWKPMFWWARVLVVKGLGKICTPDEEEKNSIKEGTMIEIDLLFIRACQY